MTLKKSVSVFGVTGSIGASTVDVLKSHTDKYVVEAVTAHRNVDAFLKVLGVLFGGFWEHCGVQKPFQIRS